MAIYSTKTKFSWARAKRERTYFYDATRVKLLREQCRVLFGEDALRSVRKYEGEITTVELNTKFIEGLLNQPSKGDDMYQHVKTRNHDDVIAGQIDFGRAQALKNKSDLEQLEAKFPAKKTERPAIEKETVICNCPDEPVRFCENCGGEINKKRYYPSQYKKLIFCCMKCVGESKNKASKNSTETIPIAEPVFLQIPLKTGVFDVTEEYVIQLQSGFPERNVRLELEKIKQWNEANPTRRKTEAGIKKHIFTWLNRGPWAPPVQEKQKPTHEANPESKWDEIKEIWMIAGVEDYILDEWEKIYDLGFRHGSGSK